MAKQEYRLRCDLDSLLRAIDKGILSGMSASYEDGSSLEADGVRCAVRVYERYSWAGGNRLSLCVTLFGKDGDVQLTAITSGGSQAMFFKINTWGEEAFLDKFVRQAEAYQE